MTRQRLLTPLWGSLKLFLLLTLFATAAPAQSFFHRVKNYANSHKELLIGDVIVFAAWSADAASSVHCQKILGCTETNPLLGKHPNEFGTWLAAMAPATALVTLDHLAWHYAPDKFDRHLFWFGPVGTAGLEFFNVKSNVDAAEFLQNGNRVPQPRLFHRERFGS